MNPSSTLPLRRTQASWLIHASGLAGGLVFTCAIAAGLAYFSTTPSAPPPEEEEEASAVDIPEPPPPPLPIVNQRATPLPPAPMIFEEAPSTSSVRIAPTPIPINPLIADVRPRFSLHFDFNPGDFQPSNSDWEPDVDHVFQRSEVDQQPVAIYRKAPKITEDLFKAAKNPRVRLLFVVNVDGSVSDVRLMKSAHPEFDKIVIEAIREWRFRPAMRKGKKVRQLVELPLYVKPPNSSPFSVN